MLEIVSRAVRNEDFAPELACQIVPEFRMGALSPKLEGMEERLSVLQFDRLVVKSVVEFKHQGVTVFVLVSLSSTF